MKLADRLNLSSVNMAIRLNFNDLLKRINALISRVDDAEETLDGGVVTSFNGRTGAVIPKTSDYSSSYVETVAGRRGDVVLVMADITDDLPGSRVTGTVGVDNGGTGADLSATGGSGQVLKQTSAGGAITVGQLASTDLSDTASIIRTTDAIFGEEPLLQRSFTTRTKCYLRAKAAGAGDVFGVFVPHRIELNNTGFGTSKTTVSTSTTNCSITTATEDRYGIKFEITSTAAGDCYAEGVYDVRAD